MINKINFSARNLTSNAGLFLLFENTKANGTFELIDIDLVFDNDATNKIKVRQQIKTFRLNYVFLAAKIIRSVRYIVMKLPAKYPYQDVYEKCLA